MMRKARVFVNQQFAGIFTQLNNNEYHFDYHPSYHGHPVSLTIPISQAHYKFKQFPAFFDGLLPEGLLLEALLKKCKLDRYDYFKQLITVGQDLVGAITLEEIS